MQKAQPTVRAVEGKRKAKQSQVSRQEVGSPPAGRDLLGLHSSQKTAVTLGKVA